jgi:uncharacterized protein (TIGR00106 family)
VKFGGELHSSSGSRFHIARLQPQENKEYGMLVEFTVVPLGLGESLAEPVAEALKIVNDSGVRYQLTPAGTCLEGDWDEVMTVIRQCHTRLLSRSVHVITTIRIEDEIGARDKLTSNVRPVERKLDRNLCA